MIKYTLPAIVLIAFASVACAEQPADDASQLVKLDEQLDLRVPAEFQSQRTARIPPSFVAVGPSPDGSGKKRPAVLVFLLPRVAENGRAGFLAKAKTLAENNMAKFGLKITDTIDVKRKDGIDGANMIATNDAGTSWWAVRTIHFDSHSVMMIIATFEKPEFDRLTDYGKHVAVLAH